MPGNVAGAVDVPLTLFGGLVTDMSPADLPHGVSPDCADVAFFEGAVRTRPGLVSVFAPLPGNPTVNYLKTYVTPAAGGTLRLLALDSGGTLYKETSPGTLASVASALAANSFARSATLFGREYIAISDGKAGNDLPRQYDDSNFDRVSQVGPGAAPTAAAEASTVANITASGASRSSNVVTITTAVAHGFQAGWSVAIAGVTDASFNGTFTIASVPSSTTFTYSQTGANATSGNGTATANPAGSIAPGLHKVVVFFKTRQGYLTAPSPPASWTAAGSRRVAVTAIPTGPSNVMARILAFTGVGGATFYFISAMVIADNTTTAATLDFSEAQLLAGTNVDGLFRLVELGECSGVIDYAQRLFWWGERNKQNNWLNLTFDGGWNGNLPLGWTAGPNNAGGSRESSLVAWGDAYRITGDAAAAVRGEINQPAVQDSNGVARIAPNVDYSVRARVLKGGGITQGRLTIDLYSASGGIDTVGLQVTAAQAPAAGGFAEFTAQLTAPLATIPSDLVLRVFVEGIPAPAGGFLVVENIHIYPTAQPVNTSLVRASRVEDPESYDGVNGILSVAENNGQRITSAFRLRERLYFVKEHSLYVTEDDGVNEPSLWSIEEVSRSVGTPSIHGVDLGEDWAVIANRSGLYLFWGGEPVKISQEIQPTWDSINWQYGHTIWVRADLRNKRILCGVPIAPATSPNRVLVLDYRGLSSAEEIAARPPVHISLAGKLVATDKARKWAPWFISANSAALTERVDGTAEMFLGNGAGNGKVYQLSDAALSDDGAAINSHYTTYFFPEESLEQAAGLGAHRKLFCYLSTRVEGLGTLSLTAFINSTGSALTQQPLALASPATRDLELPINILGERVSFKVGTNAAGNWFRLQRLVPVVRPDPWAPVRGAN